MLAAFVSLCVFFSVLSLGIFGIVAVYMRLVDRGWHTLAMVYAFAVGILVLSFVLAPSLQRAMDSVPK